MSEEEFFNRMINQISKVFDGRIATKMKNIYLKKDKQLNKQKEVLDKIKEWKKQTLFDLNGQYKTFEYWEELFEDLDILLEEIE